jgi:type I restriction enzyme S subunit
MNKLTSKWESAPLGDIAPTNGNRMPDDNKSVWNLSLEDIEANTGKVISKVYCRVDSLGSTKCSFDQRHVLYSKLRPYLNKVVIPDSHGVGTSELIPLLPNTDRIKREFLAWYLRSPQFVEFAKMHTRGANLPRISMSDFWRHKVPFPRSHDEQHRILERINESMERIEETINLLPSIADDFTALKRSLLFGESRQKSKWKIVGDLVDWVKETESVAKKQVYDFAGVRSFGRGVFAGPTKNSSDFQYAHVRRLQEKDFIYPKLMAWEGAFGMVPKGLVGRVVSPEFMVFRAKEEKILPEILDTYFRSPFCLEDVRSGSTGSNQRRRRLNPKEFLKLKIPVPSINRQLELREVHRIEQQMLESRLQHENELIAIRDAILRKAFSGEL